MKFLITCFLGLVFSSSLLGQSFFPGKTYFSEQEYIEYFTGDGIERINQNKQTVKNSFDKHYKT